MTEAQQKLSTFPAFFRVSGRMVVVVGEGEEAFAKARLLFNTDARIVVLAEAPEADFARFIAEKGLVLVRVPFSKDAIADATLVFAATGDAAADRAISTAARALRIPVNAVDQPDYCDFFTPALVNRAPVAVAIGTEGAGPVLAQMIRAQVVSRTLPAATARPSTASCRAASPAASSGAASFMAPQPMLSTTAISSWRAAPPIRC